MSDKLEEISNVRLQEKVCIITGGASGIGEATAQLFAAHGAHVIIADVQDADGQAVVAGLPPPGRHHYIHCDVTVEEDVAAAVDMAVSTFGRLDVMFNNAGICPYVGPLHSLDMQLWDRVQAVNVRGVVLGMKHASRVMVPVGHGIIINSTSVAATVAPEEGDSAYVPSKHAVLGLTKAGAVELGKVGIRVNSVAPSALMTPLMKNRAKQIHMTEARVMEMLRLTEVLKRETPLQAEDVAQAVLFLASDNASYINGHNLVVDGGYTITSRTMTLSG